MAIKRGAFQGVFNIIRFNWHFYLLATIVFVGLWLLLPFLPTSLVFWAKVGWCFSLLPMIVSLVISYYIYDLSDLYELSFLTDLNDKKVLNINAGFDETSAILHQRFPQCQLTVCDFYNPSQHTEVSVKRARKAYPPYAGTIAVTTHELPFSDESFDTVTAILSAHEIRKEEERILFFKELHRVTKTGGKIYVTEHLRDVPNFMAYTIGFLHFHAKRTWLDTFQASNWSLEQERKTTPFISTFILKKDGITP